MPAIKVGVFSAQTETGNSFEARAKAMLTETSA